jgi:hypothetical protein
VLLAPTLRARRRSAMSNLVHNERLKLRATFFRNSGKAEFIACFVTPGFFEFRGDPD